MDNITAARFGRTVHALMNGKEWDADTLDAIAGAAAVMGHPLLSPEEVPTLPTQTYADADVIMQLNPSGWFVVETDDGVSWTGPIWARRAFDELAPGEAFTIHSVHPTRREAQVAARTSREGQS